MFKNDPNAKPDLLYETSDKIDNILKIAGNNIQF